MVDRYLIPYFPPLIMRRFAGEAPGHRLRRELVATQLVNELVDTMGAIFVFGLVRDFDLSAEQAVRAWVIAADTIGLREEINRIKARSRELMVEAELEGAFRAGAGGQPRNASDPRGDMTAKRSVST